MPKREQYKNSEPTKPFNPLEKRHLGHSVADALIQQPRQTLPPKERFEGAGVYAIYYSGDYELYAPISNLENTDQIEVPIYVGKAIPAGGRKGGLGLDAPAGYVLYNRLCEHADSIKSTSLKLNHFFCRYLIVDDIWIPLGESLLIERFNPLWNSVLDGFGNHDPGIGRHQGKKPAWDALHVGRAWADKLQPSQRTPTELRQHIKDHLARYKTD